MIPPNATQMVMRAAIRGTRTLSEDRSMLKLSLLGISSLSHVAIASAHFCDCLDPNVALHWYHVLAASGYASIGGVTVFSFISCLRAMVRGANRERKTRIRRRRQSSKLPSEVHPNTK